MTTIKMFVSCISKQTNAFKIVEEENNLKDKIARLLRKEGYKFLITEKFLSGWSGRPKSPDHGGEGK